MDKAQPRVVRRNLLICLGLIVLTGITYWQVLGFELTYFDDDVYVADNATVLRGLTWDGVKWAFTTNWQANWHPLTWLSLMSDAAIGGESPAVFHATNVVLHMLSTVLLFAILSLLTGLPWRSAFVAALFAVHPLHVESVAWVAERKDTLSAVFWMLTILAYVRYARSPGRVRYLLTTALFALGLMAKPMLVTLPVVLLLIDFWPLARVQGKGDREQGTEGKRPVSFLLLEKTPLFGMSAASCCVTIWAQIAGGAMGNLESYPLGVRVANALVAYVSYMAKMLWPVRLSVFYPHPVDSLPVWQVICSALLLIGLSALAFGLRRRRPYVLVGWLLYVITLLPVIGLVQVGDQAMADRYTYIPLIGLFVAITWWIAESLGGNRLLHVGAVGMIAGLAVLSIAQVGTWRDSGTLFRHAIAVTRNNTLAYNNLGLYALYTREDPHMAIRCYSRSIRIREESGLAHNGLGTALGKAGRHEEAVKHLRRAIELGFERPGVYSNLAMELLKLGEPRRALGPISRAVELAPQDDRIRYNRALVYEGMGAYDKALRELQQALRFAPPDDRPRIEARIDYLGGTTDHQ
jgi:tetratricopeptide (TPR) repeat protein